MSEKIKLIKKAIEDAGLEVSDFAAIVQGKAELSPGIYSIRSTPCAQGCQDGCRDACKDDKKG